LSNRVKHFTAANLPLAMGKSGRPRTGKIALSAFFHRILWIIGFDSFLLKNGGANVASTAQVSAAMAPHDPGRMEETMSLSKRSVETLLDLVEIKLSCIEVFDREDQRERHSLEAARKELTALIPQRNAAKASETARSETAAHH
jgi:hypothetical protein